MAQRMIYHWKHGWIPLDHYAALSKAHGRESGAKLLMGRLGVTGEDGKSHHLEQSLQAKHGKSYEDLLREADSRRTKPLQSTVDRRFQDRSAIRNKTDVELTSLAEKLRPGSEAHTAVLAEMKKRGLRS
jgi:hypothetical protein